jgi:hypothetical protein
MQGIAHRRQAVAQVVAGLEMLVGKENAEAKKNAPTGTDESPESEEPDVSVTDAALYVIRHDQQERGAKDIERRLAELGFPVNYYTLYKALRRAATRGLLYRNGEKFGLREWRETAAKTNG